MIVTLVALEPAEDGGELEVGLAGVLLGEVEDERAAKGGEVALEGLGGIGGDEEEGVVAGGVFPAVFDGGAGLADAAHAVDGLLAADDGGFPGGEGGAEGDHEVGAADEEGADGLREVAGAAGGDVERQLHAPDVVEERRAGGVCVVEGGAVLGEVRDEGLLASGEGGVFRLEGRDEVGAGNEEGEDRAAQVAGDEVFPLGEGEGAAVRALVAQGGGWPLGLAAMRGADEGDDAVAGMELVLEHLRHAAPIGREAALDDGLGAAFAEDVGDFVGQPGQPCGGAGEEDAGFARGSH